jgi:urea transport system ATP-binding protein
MTPRMLSIEQVSVSFDGFTVLNGLDFSIDQGELRFLIGPNGAGKTTLLDIVTGRTRPTAGRVLFDGRIDVARYPEHDLVRLGIGRKFQTPTVFPSLTVRQNVEVAVGRGYGWPSLFRKLSSAERDHIDAVLTTVGLIGRARESAATLSHGEMQWLEIAMLLIADPRLLLLDEPVAGMTRAEREQTGQLLEAIAGNHTILVVEHDMAFVRQFARQVSVLHLGQILSEGSIDDVQRDPRVVEVYLGKRTKRERGRHAAPA